jgi:hypothetical protein
MIGRIIRSMAKITVTLPDESMRAVTAAASAAGKSVSAWVAAAADAAATRDAAARFRAALAGNPAAAAEHDEALRLALDNGRRAAAATASLYGDAA